MLPMHKRIWQHEMCRRAARNGYPFSTTSPSFRKCAFFAFRIRHSLSRPSEITTLYSGQIANEPISL